MTRIRLLIIVSACTLATASSGLGAQQTAPAVNRPGMPSVARMYILNKGLAEAVPVALQNAGEILPVAVMSAPASRVARQSWEYRQVATSSGQDLSVTFNILGADGWEAVGAVSGGPGLNTWLFKRPN